jgi:hypothetical protein
MKTLFKQLLIKTIAYHPTLAELTGSTSSAVLLSQILYWWKACGEKDFYKTDEDFCDELSMGLDEFKGAKKRIKELNFVKIYVRGLPGKTYYSVDMELMEKTLTSKWKSHQVESGNPTKAVVEIPPTFYTENTKDVSSEKNSDAEQEKKEADPLKNLPSWMGNAPLKRLVKVYSMIWEDMYGFAPTLSNWGQLGKQFKPLLTKYTEYQIASMIALHFEWKGADGNDDFTHKRLSNKCFPLEWVPKAVNEYQAYLINSLGLAFDQPEKVKAYVVKIIKPLIKK